AGGDADEDALFLRQRLRAFHRVRAGHRQYAVDRFLVDRLAGDARDEVGRPALHRVRLEGRMGLGRRAVGIARLRLAGGEHRRIGRFADDDLRFRPLAAQHARDAGQRAAGAEAGHPVVELLALEVVDDLAPGRALVHVRVGLVLELARHEPAVLGGELLRLVDHAEGALRRRRQDHLGAEEAHQLAPLDGKALGHGYDERVALRRADHGEADAGVAGGRLYDRLPGLERAGFLRRLDDAEREPVLDRAERIEGLDLDVEVDALRRQFVDAHDR